MGNKQSNFLQSAVAQYKLRCNFYFGHDGKPQDYVQAVRYFRLAAAQEHVRAQFNLGVCYQYGQGVKKDLQEAVKYYRLAAEQEDEHAQLNLGLCYANGQGVKKDLQEAVKYYRLAAAQGLAEAQCNLGVCYKNGLGLKKDLQEAVKYYRLAAAQGLAEAQCNLGVCYKNGLGLKKDLQEAVKYYRLAAAQGLAEAQCNLGVCYKNGLGLKKDLQEAVKYYRLAAAQGLAEAQCNLGVCYKNGLGLKKDLQEAVKYYQFAATQGNVYAQCNLGICYENGQGVKKDLQEAVKYYQLAANQACVEAQYNLGRCYQYGIGKLVSIVYAITYYNLAAKAGSEQASKALAIISKKSSEGKSIPASPITASFHIPYKDLTVGNKLGEGAFGSVHKGKWHYNKVAIKLFSSNSLNKASLQELQREVQIITKMKSDYIINLKGICIEKPNYAIIMELMPKGSLTDLLHSKDEISWKTRYGIGSDIGFGLQQLHDNNILHGDLKSMNVLITDSFRAKICDFGLSKIKNKIKSKSYVASSLAWMAAELKMDGENTKESDRFSYGMVLWELASRKLPFIASSQYVPIPEGCPPAFGKIIKACWGKEGKPLTRMKPAIAAKKLANMHQKSFKSVSSKSTASSSYRNNNQGADSSYKLRSRKRKQHPVL